MKRMYLNASFSMAALLARSLFNPTTGHHILEPHQQDARPAARHKAGERARKRAVARRIVIERSPEQQIIHRMTGWQRNQWARAGYPKSRIGEFAKMQRRA